MKFTKFENVYFLWQMKIVKTWALMLYEIGELVKNTNSVFQTRVTNQMLPYMSTLTYYNNFITFSCTDFSIIY